MSIYLPVLLVSVTTNSIPDDSSVTTLPRGQVDYLSHDWTEEDVWRSWRNMTRQKNEITNGMRLENASWRTWWKQRNNLKTVMPETLNWLKDSDVTWLYGPLHTAVEWTPPPKPKPDPTSVDDKDPASVHDRFDLNPGTRRHITKPILKHRTIGELLTSDLSNTSPLYTPSQEEDEWIRDSDISDVQEGEQRARPRLLHMKSESHVTRWPNRAFRKDSPPRIIAEDAETRVNTPSGGSTSQASGSDQDGAIACGPRKKHITFNTFVEQCIAIEKPKSQSDTSESGSATPRSNLQDAMYDDGYDEDSEGGVMEDDEDDVLFNDEIHPQMDDPANEECFETDSDSEEEDMIEIRTSSTPIHRHRPNAARSSSSSSSSSSRSRASNADPRRNTSTPTTRSSSHVGFRSGPALLRTPSSEKDHMTIAPIAPTILKSKGVGNGPCDEDDDYDYPHGEERKWYTNGTDVPVHLVYVPPLGSNYSMDTGAIDLSLDEGVYRHREAYFSVGTGAGRNGNGNGQIPSVGFSRTSSNEQASSYFAAAAVASSPKHRDGDEEDAYDYFGGPDMGDMGFSDRKRPRREIRTDDVAKEGQVGVVRYAQGGASSVVGGRSTGTPEVVVSGTEDEGRSRPRSRSRSKSRTPSPAECTAVSPPPMPPPSPSVAVPRGGSSHTGVSPSLAQSHTSSLLSPQDASTPSRGRSAAPVLENQSRGRSSTRGSLSDRERSSSRGTNSPIGSISPEGSAVAIAVGAFGVSANGRDPRNFAAERGRDRGAKRTVTEGVRTASPQAASVASASSSSNSSTPSGNSAVTVTPANSPTLLRINTDESTASSGSITPVAATEEERQRVKHYTPANSPVVTLKPRQFTVAPAQPSSPSTTVQLSPRGIVSHNTPSSPSSPKPEDGLVGRAVGIAGAFLGSFWSGS